MSNEIIFSRAERNDYIDFLRGIAAIGIIAAHTAFWGGQSYTPEWFWNLTLFLDVPFFFYLSGWASSYRKADIRKTCKSLMGIWRKWVFFISLLAIFCLVSKYLPVQFQGVTDVRDLVNNYMFNVSFPGFCVVSGSVWFMPYYFVVMVVNAIIMTSIERDESKSEELKKTYMWLLLGAFVWVCYGKYAFGLDLVYFLFYSFLWMMGLNRFGRLKSLSKVVLAIVMCIIGFIFTSYLQGLPLYDIQSAKFPPSLKYGIASMFVIIIVRYLDGKIKTFPAGVVHIGRNAIWYYFGQGIGSSLNFYVVDVLTLDNWILKWIITFIINVLMTIMISEILAFTYKGLSNILSSIKHKITWESSL